MSIGLLEAVRLTVIGMGVVFASLLVLYLVMLLVGHSLGREKTAGGVGPGADGPGAGTGSGAAGRAAPDPTSSP
ncbi:MAG: OadG family transporter subunit, partial [Spirochaetaceae bacterium]